VPGVRTARPDRPQDLPEFHPLRSWRLLFTENAANSSLRLRPVAVQSCFGLRWIEYKPSPQHILARICCND
jgi:hypothetical protein